MLNLYLRRYTTTGRIFFPDLQPNTAYVDGTFPVELTYINGRDTDEKVSVSLGGSSDVSGYITLSPHLASQIIDGIQQNTATASLLPGKLTQTNEPDSGTEDTEQEEQLPVVCIPIDLPGRPPGLSVIIGEEPIEAVTLEFTPAQTKDLIDVLDAFSDGDIDENLQQPVLTPSHVDAAGNHHEP